ncbi:MAG: cytochrome c biogenesis protein ResB [Opitutaceae bacterium]
MNAFASKLRQFFVSLKLTVTLLVLGMVLVFWATLAQVDLGVWGVQERFFHCFIVTERIPGTPLWAPFPGGYLIGTMLLVNLIIAHIDRFKFTARKIGIQLTHAGVILLLLGELLSGLWQESYTMQIGLGDSLNYSEHQRDFELAIIDTTSPDVDEVVAIPAELLEEGKTVQHPKLPFRVVPKRYLPNAALASRDEKAGGPPSEATTGTGPGVAVTPLPITYNDKEVNLPAAYVELTGASGSLGTWLVSPELARPQTFTAEGKTWKLVLRRERAYKPFKITLLDVKHDVYPGTDTPKNFSSRIRLETPGSAENREVLIYMNHPLRYSGLTFYQYQMNAPAKYTVLQVVRNPSWVLPYVSCIMISAGLIWQFGAHLLGFFKKRRTLAPAVA